MQLPGLSFFHELKLLVQMNSTFALLFVPVAVALVFWTLRFILKRTTRYMQHSNRHAQFWAKHGLKHIRSFFLLSVALFCVAHLLMLPPMFAKLIALYIEISLLLQATLMIHYAALHVVNHKIDQQTKLNPTAESARALFVFFTKILIWGMAGLLLLGTLGFDITALLAGLGIGGIAVGLASQKILGDLFASISIIMDNPFRVGERISIDGITGVVEYIGMKTTHIRSQTGELVLCPNADLMSAKLKNLDRMKDSRVEINLRIASETSLKALEQVTGFMRTAVAHHKECKLEEAYLNACPQGQYEFVVSFFVVQPHVKKTSVIKEKILHDVLRKLAEQGIKLAGPVVMGVEAKE